MDISRRDFLKVSSAATAGLLMGSIFDLKPIKAYALADPPSWVSEDISICCYCAVGCGVIVGSTGAGGTGQAAYVQGDPDHPINQGTICSKGQALAQLNTVDGSPNPRRLTQPMVRRPNAATWTPISWDNVLNEIVTHIRATRDTAWNAYANPGSPPSTPYTVTAEEIDGAETPVNRCLGIAAFGGAAHDNEECYLLVKLLRALGLVYIEHQARI